MEFTINDLKKLLFSIQHKNINLITINSDQLKLTINKARPTTNTILQPKKSKQTNNLNNIEILPKDKNINKYPTNTKTLPNNDIEIYSTIVSPMVGTFYRSPGPNESPFVEQNDIVQQKQTVCIIEAMKLMNEIEAEVNGEIVEILVKDGDIVDCGQALMKVKPIE